MLIVVANLAVIVALTFIYPHLMISAGPLLPAHAQPTTDCFACHAPLRGAAADRCVSCHAVADIGARPTTGVALARTPLHQQLVAQNCVAYHSEHQGSRISQSTHMTFLHALLQPATQANCASCHTAPATAFHRDLTTGCAQCYSTVRWTPATFDHARLFVLDRDHNAPCATCHVHNDTSRYTCYDCHEHRPDRISAKQLREGIRDFQNCVSCHRSAHGEP
ncbi:hypothetical protein [Roseomonas rosulenta]|uniref:hypothetical protein n=1 Tax=Roseomonas rosulenta TaxID=2748667 RepID=UPI0018DFAD51|nr:hypothetical protein [Roseomonas rosulenta]